MKKVLLLGEAMVLFTAESIGAIETVDLFRRSLAGAEVNVAIGLARLGFHPTYVTKLSTDPFGKYILNRLEEEGIQTFLISYDEEHPTGFMVKSKVTEGDPSTAYYRKHSAASHLSVDDINELDFSNIAMIHLTGVLPAISESTREATFHLLRKAQEHRIFCFFDPNIRPSLWNSQRDMVQTLNSIASQCDIVMPGITEGQLLTGKQTCQEIAAFYHGIGCQKVIIKLGANGAYASTPFESFTVPGFPVESIVDTVGAGDGFAVGVISGCLDNLSLKESCVLGNAIGAIQLSHPSDNEGLPSRKELQAFLAKHA